MERKLPFLNDFSLRLQTFTMEIPFIGREKEKEILQEALQSAEAEMVAVVGRRRVGKTFLIKKVYEKQIIFSTSGELGTPLDEHLGTSLIQST